MANILVVTDLLNGELRSVNLEIFTAARQMAADLGGSVAALMIGSGAAHAETAGKYGVSTVITVEDPALASYSPDAYAAVIAQVARDKAFDIVLMGATFTGKDLMARAAMILDTALAQECVKYRTDNGQVYFTRPMYAGKILAEVRVAGKPVMATFRSKSFKAEESGVSVTTEAFSATVPQPKAVVTEVHTASGGKIDVTEAEIIVSGGRGLKGAENWHLLEEMAELLGAATGCSRPVSDDGWRPHDEHIGQTGKTVSPSLYIACGISGAIQHIAGVSSSKYIVAINKDPEAPIFKIADYGIVGDLFEVMPAMTAAIKKLKAND